MATVSQLCGLSFACADDGDWVRITPKETDEILANPGRQMLVRFKDIGVRELE